MDFHSLKANFKPRKEPYIKDLRNERELGDAGVYNYLLKLEKAPKKASCIDFMVHNPEKTQKEIAEELKITPKTICEWKREREFNEILSFELSRTWQTRRNEVLNTFYKMAISGDTRAGELFLKTTEI